MTEINDEELWEEICFDLHSSTSTMNEELYEQKIIMSLGKMGWKQFKGEIVLKQSIPVGSTNSIIPDIIVKAKDTNLSFVIEVKKPSIPRSNINPNQGFLSNIIKSAGVVEKCHFCLHRTRNGDYPACLEACPTGARKFGNLNDPDSEVSYIIRKKRVFVLKEELNTIPSFFYYFD